MVGPRNPIATQKSLRAAGLTQKVLAKQGAPKAIQVAGAAGVGYAAYKAQDQGRLQVLHRRRH